MSSTPQAISLPHIFVSKRISRELYISCDWNASPARKAGLTGNCGYKQFLLLSVAGGGGEAVSCTASFSAEIERERLLPGALDSLHTQLDNNNKHNTLCTEVG